MMLPTSIFLNMARSQEITQKELCTNPIRYRDYSNILQFLTSFENCILDRFCSVSGYLLCRSCLLRSCLCAKLGRPPGISFQALDRNCEPRKLKQPGRSQVRVYGYDLSPLEVGRRFDIQWTTF